MGDTTKSILVPVDFSPAATQAVINAIELGEKLNAEVHLVNFIPPIKMKKHGDDNVSDINVVSDELTSSINLLKENEQKLADLLKRINTAKVQVHSEIKMDSLASGVRKLLKKKNIGLLVIGVTNAQTISDSFYNTKQAQDLIKVDCPIMLCNSQLHHFNGHHRIAVSLDLASLEHSNIEYLDYLAKVLSSEIHYFHVNHPQDKAACTKEEIQKYLAEHNLVADSIDILNSDNKETAIRDYANERHADFIAINRFSRSTQYKECHTERVADANENLIFVY